VRQRRRTHVRFPFPFARVPGGQNGGGMGGGMGGMDF
jgi:hypothetical protein